MRKKIEPKIKQYYITSDLKLFDTIRSKIIIGSDNLEDLVKRFTLNLRIKNGESTVEIKTYAEDIFSIFGREIIHYKVYCSSKDWVRTSYDYYLTEVR